MLKEFPGPRKDLDRGNFVIPEVAEVGIIFVETA
jgi:hypothetical protein